MSRLLRLKSSAFIMAPRYPIWACPFLFSGKPCAAATAFPGFPSNSSFLFGMRSGDVRHITKPRPKRFIITLLGDDHRFVQKAVGWSLREALTPFPTETTAFVRRHAQALSPVAFAEATRKLSPELRGEIIARRRLRARSGKSIRSGAAR